MGGFYVCILGLWRDGDDGDERSGLLRFRDLVGKKFGRGGGRLR